MPAEVKMGMYKEGQGIIKHFQEQDIQTYSVDCKQGPREREGNQNEKTSQNLKILEEPERLYSPGNFKPWFMEPWIAVQVPPCALKGD